MIVQRCRAPLSAHNVMNLCCPIIFAPNAAATGERQSSKKKKNRMIALVKPGKLVGERTFGRLWPGSRARTSFF